ncbi:MAG: hypothetical protein ONB46_02850 [candidate division KSB1 bacterium]|nr:hypothetical protein [candidate division KSB1 bacterium]MDZ7364825.1 hypothetical protein [candidate division KSB1 bacterium]MDZ7402928.1 hypothetical protein [candidate division KSB1 bacterium]
MNPFLKKLPYWILVVAAFALLAVSGCKDNPADPGEDNEQELITSVTLNLTELDAAGNPTATIVSVNFKDPDGPGGTAPTIGTLTLKAGKNYKGTIKLLDETKNPAEDIAAEIKREADAHQFFYTPKDGIVGRVTVTITDRDSRNLPLGLEYNLAVTAGAAASGKLNVVLSHYQPASKKNGTTRSDESDVDIDFPVNITN